MMIVAVLTNLKSLKPTWRVTAGNYLEQNWDNGGQKGVSYSSSADLIQVGQKDRQAAEQLHLAN